jgi:hypothetical protein
VYADAGGMESAGSKATGAVKRKAAAMMRTSEDSGGYCRLSKSAGGLCRP